MAALGLALGNINCSPPSADDSQENLDELRLGRTLGRNLAAIGELPDFNGDGMDDYYYRHLQGGGNILKFNNYKQTGSYMGDVAVPGLPYDWWQYKIMLADVNGDGLSDLYLHSKVNGGYDYLGLGLGNGQFQIWTQVFPYNWYIFDAELGDVDGDGRADLVLAGVYGIYYGRSNGVDFHLWDNYIAGDYHEWVPRMGDFNGDGRADLYLHARANSSRTVDLMAFSNGSGFILWSGIFPYDWRGYEMHFADINGDRKADIYGHGLPGTHANDWFALSNGTAFNFITWVNDDDWTDLEVRLGDVTGDGQADLVLRSIGHKPGRRASYAYFGVAASIGNSFDLVEEDQETVDNNLAFSDL